MTNSTMARAAERLDTPVFDRARIAVNDNTPNSHFDKPDPIDADDTPTGTGPIRTPSSVAAAQARRLAEKASMALARAAIGKRQSIGNPDADNDNEHFPLMTALKREGDNDSIAVVLRYRELVALSECQPLQGQRLGGGDMPAARRSTNLTAETDSKIAAMKKTDTILPGGEIRYKEVKKRKGGTFHLPAKQAVATNEETRVRTASLAMPFNADLLVRKLDGQHVLDALRAALGPLLEPFEDAVLGGRTYAEIGRAEGASIKPDVAGKTLVKKAILAVEDVMHKIDRSIRLAEQASDKRASVRRCEIAVETARFLARAT